MFALNKNRKYFFNLCEALIMQYEKEPSKFSSKSIIMQEIKSSVSEDSDSKSFFAKIIQSDYEEVANSFLSNICFDELISGKYHLHYGFLNPMSEAKNLLSVYKGAMNWALVNNKITRDELEEQYSYLQRCIASVG